jgi:hypothetical protein
MTVQQLKKELENLRKEIEPDTSKKGEIIIYGKTENIPQELLDDDSIPFRVFIPDDGRNPDIFNQEEHYKELIKQSRVRRKALGLPEWRDTK